MKVLIVVPARNEAGSLPAVVADLRRDHPQRAILIVDDGSTDETAVALAGLPVARLHLSSTVGIGGAMRAGFRFATAEGFDAVVRVDGDGQHDAASIGMLLAPIARGDADVVRGSRYLLSENYHAVGFRRIAQRAVAWLVAMVINETVTDPTCGFWAFGPRAVPMLANHHPTGYPEPELMLLLHRNRMRTMELPVRMRERVTGRSSLDAIRTSLAMFRVLLALLIVPMRPAVTQGRHE